MEQQSAFELIRAHLNQPEYLHVLLNPVPVYGTALGLVALLVAMALRSRAAHVTALTVLLLSAAAAWPVVVLGEKGYDVVESLSDHNGAHWLDAHAQRATRFVWVFYATAAVAAAAIAVPWKYPRAALPLNIVTLLFALAALGVGGWIAFAGGQARHKEFRAPGAIPSEPLGGYEKMRD